MEEGQKKKRSSSPEMRKLPCEQVLQVSYLKNDDSSGFWADGHYEDLMVLVQAEELLLPLVFL